MCTYNTNVVATHVLVGRYFSFQTGRTFIKDSQELVCQLFQQLLGHTPVHVPKPTLLLVAKRDLKININQI